MRYGSGVAGRVRALGGVDAVFGALSQPTPDRAPGALDETVALLAEDRLRLRAQKTTPMQQAAEAHRQLAQR